LGCLFSFFLSLEEFHKKLPRPIWPLCVSRDLERRPPAGLPRAQVKIGFFGGQGRPGGSQGPFTTSTCTQNFDGIHSRPRWADPLSPLLRPTRRPPSSAAPTPSSPPLSRLPARPRSATPHLRRASRRRGAKRRLPCGRERRSLSPLKSRRQKRRRVYIHMDTFSGMGIRSSPCGRRPLTSRAKVERLQLFTA